jgi:hypothetical protein
LVSRQYYGNENQQSNSSPWKYHGTNVQYEYKASFATTILTYLNIHPHKAVNHEQHYQRSTFICRRSKCLSSIHSASPHLPIPRLRLRRRGLTRSTYRPLIHPSPVSFSRRHSKSPRSIDWPPQSNIPKPHTPRLWRCHAYCKLCSGSKLKVRLLRARRSRFSSCHATSVCILPAGTAKSCRSGRSICGDECRCCERLPYSHYVCSGNVHSGWTSVECVCAS